MARHPTRRNLRQVDLLEHELLDELQRLGFDVKPGALGENIITRNLPLLELKAGSIVTPTASPASIFRLEAFGGSIRGAVTGEFDLSAMQLLAG